MADASYDAIVIGGGANGLLVALYLQDAGMQTAVFERNMEIGGGLCGDEVPLPGFLTNTCATNVRFYTTPCYEDFNLGEYGLKQIFPKAGQGMIFDDEGQRVLRIMSGGGFQDWGIVIGPVEMEVPDSENYKYSGGASEYHLKLVDGAYVYYELQ